MNYTELTGYIRQQTGNRELWQQTDSPERIAGYLAAETAELQEAIQEAYITGDVYSVASEIGDLQYLLIRLGELLGIDPVQAAEVKLARNSYKYADHIASNGRNYEEAAQVIRQVWQALGGDQKFSHIYLDLLAAE